MGGDRPIVISGIGAVTGFGVGWPRARDALARGARALRAAGAASPGLDGFTLGIAPVGGLLHPYHLGALRRYYRCLIRRGAFRLGDGQSPLRYNAHDEREL
jgi:hypothetical protein